MRQVLPDREKEIAQKEAVNRTHAREFLFAERRYALMTQNSQSVLPQEKTDRTYIEGGPLRQFAGWPFPDNRSAVPVKFDAGYLIRIERGVEIVIMNPKGSTQLRPLIGSGSGIDAEDTLLPFHESSAFDGKKFLHER